MTTVVCPFCGETHEFIHPKGTNRILISCVCQAHGSYGYLLNSPEKGWFWSKPAHLKEKADGN
jgi:hypothetical protein